VIQAGKDERRFCVLNVSDKKKGDIEYFRKIVEQMNNGGQEAMLYDLLRLDLSGIDLRTIPKTQALLEQKERSMEPLERFLYERLQEGTTLSSQQDGKAFTRRSQYATESLISSYQEEWARIVVTDVWYTGFLLFCESIRSKEMLTKNHFVRRLRKNCPGIAVKKKVTVDFGYSPKKANGIKIPPLEECRKQFEEHLGQPINWDE
jgi:hypothetical protein